MIHYEIKAIPAPGQAQALIGTVAAYRDLLSKHGAKSAESYVVAAGNDVGSLVHIISYDTIAAAEKVQAAVQNDADWNALQTEVAPLVASYSITTLNQLA